MTDTATEVQTGNNGSRPRGVTVTQSTSAGPEAKTPIGTAPIIPLILIGTGAYLLWFMVHYWRQTGANVWPSAPIKSILQGKGIQTTAASKAPATSGQVAAYEQGLATQIAAQETSGVPATTGGGGSGGGSGSGGPPPTGSAQNMAKLLLSRYGWAATEMGPLISLWTRESGWNPNARNGTSGAYGIAQALGHGTSCSAAKNGTNEYGNQYGLSCSDAQAANSGSALQQIRWGLGYIKSRYGSPAAAWAHETQFGWY